MDEIAESFCLCDRRKSSTCGRKAVSDTTPDRYEPQDHVRIAVPVIVGGRRRRKRQIEEEVPLSDDWRLYQTSYRWF